MSKVVATLVLKRLKGIFHPNGCHKFPKEERESEKRQKFSGSGKSYYSSALSSKVYKGLKFLKMEQDYEQIYEIELLDGSPSGLLDIGHSGRVTHARVR